MKNKGMQPNTDGISEKSKEALQSETWEKVRKAKKTEIMHFTETPEVLDFAMVKVSKDDNVYGAVWGNVVKEYLMTAYSGEGAQADVVLDGITYKTLKRRGGTTFYDADGNTLFDVEDKRLGKEYGWLMNGRVNADAHNPVPDSADRVSAKEKAKEKLEKELKSAKDKTFAEPILGYLLKRCEEDKGMAEDVAQEHKTWKKCFDYIYGQARKQAKGNCAAIRDEVVYEWAEDYYHKDDKAGAKRREKTEEKKTAAKQSQDKIQNDKGIPAKKEKNKEHKKKNSKEMEGQLDMFSIMGM